MKNQENFRKGNIKNKVSGITLIALVVTIIVLLILAGVAIAMLRGDNGILTKTTEAKYLNGIAQFDEQTKLASMAVRTSIEANKVSTPGYIATTAENLQQLATEVAKELGVTAVDAKNNTGNLAVKASTDGYTVAYYLDKEGNTSQDGNGYIVIWYTDNSLRSSIDMDNLSQYGLNIISKLSTDETENKKLIKNQATLVCVIHVENYKAELSDKGITSLSDADIDITKEKFKDTTDTNKQTSLTEITYGGTKDVQASITETTDDETYSDDWIIAWKFDGTNWSNPFSRNNDLMNSCFPDIDLSYSIDYENDGLGDGVKALLYPDAQGNERRL